MKTKQLSLGSGMKSFIQSNPARMAFIIAAVLYLVTIILTPTALNLNAIGSIIMLTLLLSFASAGNQAKNHYQGQKQCKKFFHTFIPPISDMQVGPAQKQTFAPYFWNVDILLDNRKSYNSNPRFFANLCISPCYCSVWVGKIIIFLNFASLLSACHSTFLSEI